MKSALKSFLQTTIGRNKLKIKYLISLNLGTTTIVFFFFYLGPALQCRYAIDWILPPSLWLILFYFQESIRSMVPINTGVEPPRDSSVSSCRSELCEDRQKPVNTFTGFQPLLWFSHAVAVWIAQRFTPDDNAGHNAVAVFTNSIRGFKGPACQKCFWLYFNNLYVGNS